MQLSIKPLWIAAIAFSLSFIACESITDPNPEPDAITFELSSLGPTIIGSKNDLSIPVISNFSNTTGSNINLKWQRINDNLPTDWTVAVEDNVQLWTPTTTEKSLSVLSDVDFDFKVHFFPNGSAGTGNCQLLIFDPLDSLRTVQIINFSAEAN